ncbi:KedN5 family methylcobalamin-dependent radical SAM C-methyltransferase [Actinomadura sp. DC4]|uniref:KedN5 family methylcobalamin-dependent radical SAM C-methyltransferase n=1 Tax=Actinomadura sp. DC4 TaxID=3055069 RepID=UPI0025B19119|nr:KedN5 family methylcobalamin-dependent radical SAM C-methyltransferase [Actinomadura sp. DC4]MDN3360026.1 KedN5 family methylcobalamin-dependent radical SAM C-methyltransferase [Actinomadura sp. DC4]
MERKGTVGVSLVQQGVWDMPLESMPLASGYMKAAALADEEINRNADIKIHNYRGGVTHAAMANDLLADSDADILAFSVLGWNFRTFGSLAATYKQINPDGWVVFGGTHVANQAERVFQMFPEVDIVVNGEGELTFRELLRAYIDGASKNDLGWIAGISYQDSENNTRTTEDRDRIEDLDIIPSPFLTGAIDLTNDDGEFRYDVALMETNRGCPYKCAFCYWGGAVGQRVRAFSRERLRAELEIFAKHKVHTIVACDANFGMLPIDVEFVDDLIDIRERYGFPRAFETSWAKNKSKAFYEIVHKMNQADMRSSFTLALQTLSPASLETMNRRNMKVNDWQDLADWLDEEGLDCYAELIWGTPGETTESFIQGYDQLARRVSRIAVYPILLLPNTDYMEKKDELGIVSVRGDTDDFEYVLAHNTMTFEENQQMQRFLFWARVVAENAVLRHVWVALRELADITQSQLLRSLDTWVAETDDPAAGPLRTALASALGGTSGFGAAITYLYVEPEAGRLLERWWAEAVRPLVPGELTAVVDAVFTYDLLTQPVCTSEEEAPANGLSLVQVRGQRYYVRENVTLDYDVPKILTALRKREKPDLTPAKKEFGLYYKTGAMNAVTSTNHEVIVHYMGMTRDQVLASAAMTEEDGVSALIADSNC